MAVNEMDATAAVEAGGIDRPGADGVDRIDLDPPGKLDELDCAAAAAAGTGAEEVAMIWRGVVLRAALAELDAAAAAA